MDLEIVVEIKKSVNDVLIKELFSELKLISIVSVFISC